VGTQFQQQKPISMELGLDNSFHWSPNFLNILQKIREGEGERGKK
jgi:hypothetical protein